SGAGDSFQTNAMVDNVLVAYGANCDKRAALYAAGRDQGAAALSGVWRPARLSADHPDDRHARPPSEQHRARASQAATGGRRGFAAGIRGPVTRPLLS